MSAATWQQARAWWSQRPAKERWLLGGAAAVLLLGLADAAWLGPQRKDIQREKAQLQKRSAVLDTARQQQALAGSPAPATDAAELLARVQQAEQRLAELRAQAAESSRLPEMLRSLTLTVGQTHLLALDLSPGTAAPRTGTGAGTAGLHRLPVSLKVGGNWNELHSLLTQVERHAQSLHWSQLTLDSGKWPTIELTLKGYAISPSPHWGQTP